VYLRLLHPAGVYLAPPQSPVINHGSNRKSLQPVGKWMVLVGGGRWALGGGWYFEGQARTAENAKRFE